MANYLQLGRELYRAVPMIEGSPLMVYNEKALQKLGKNNPNLIKALNEVIGNSTNPSLEVLNKANGNYGIASFRIKSNNKELLSGAYSKSEEASGIVEKYRVMKDGVLESSHTPRTEVKSAEAQKAVNLAKETVTKNLFDEMKNLGQIAHSREWLPKGPYETTAAEYSKIKPAIEVLNKDAKNVHEYVEKIISQVNKEIDKGHFEWENGMQILSLDNGKMKVLFQGNTKEFANILCYDSKLYPKFDMSISIDNGKIKSVSVNSRANNEFCQTTYSYNDLSAQCCFNSITRDIEDKNLYETIKFVHTPSNGDHIFVS